MTKIEVLPAIRAAEKVLEIIVDLEPEEIQEALDAIGKAGATFGILWGFGGPQYQQPLQCFDQSILNIIFPSFSTKSLGRRGAHRT